jgi:hypothetical protein
MKIKNLMKNKFVIMIRGLGWGTGKLDGSMAC